MVSDLPRPTKSRAMNQNYSPDSSTGGYPSKRPRLSPHDTASPHSATNSHVHAAHQPSPPGDAAAGGKAGQSQSSSFRNVSACNRCRMRKNRCDQRLPSCASCDKANVKCVGYDPITKREIPRSYVFYLESRINYLENLLQKHEVSYAPADALEIGSRSAPDQTAPSPATQSPAYNAGSNPPASNAPDDDQKQMIWNRKRDESEKLNKLVSNVGMVPVQGASDPRYLGSTSGISFARVVFAAVKSSVSGGNSEKGDVKPSNPISAKAVGAGGTSMRDSFFGLQTKPTIQQAPFPDKELGLRLVTIFFEYSNPQIPILHRGEFMKMFEEVYADPSRPRTPRESYMLNIVYAIGSGIFLGEVDKNKSESDHDQSTKSSPKSPRLPKPRASNQQCQPEEYHASAIVHLEACLSSSSLTERPDGFGGGLEELQAVLLLAGFALLRPVAPGLWYIVGVAVRLAVDLGLHYEDGKDIETGLEGSSDLEAEKPDGTRLRQESSSREKGRREWIRDLRRRLWWCTYSFDRLVSTCVGRPFGITDQAITTEFPSLLDDKYITKEGFLQPEGPNEPTYKHVSYHYIRLRLLQSEILQVLQFQQAQIIRAGGANQRNPYMHTQLHSPFLSKFESFRKWRVDIDRRLYEWKTSAPSNRDTGVRFSPDFLELNYWQAIITLYRQSLSVPTVFEGEYTTVNEVESPSAHTVELREDEERVFLKVAEAGQRTLRLYRSLHRLKLVNYTFLATHHLFMAGISFLYAIWHSPIVRSRLTMDEVDFTILAATSVLGDLIKKCPPAEACRDAFDRMSKATVQMCMSTTGFSSSAQALHEPYRNGSSDHFGGTTSNQFAMSNARSSKSSRPPQQSATGRPKQNSNARPVPNFDMGLHDLFPAPSPEPSSSVQAPQTQSAYQIDNHRSRTIKDENVGNHDNFSSSKGQFNNPGNYTVSPIRAQLAVDTSSIDPSLLPSAQQTQRLQPYSTDSSMMYNNNNDNNFGDLDFSNMDFLNSEAGNSMGGVNIQGQTGLDLGFGLGWEGLDHDFSEGNQLDIFDGFFFGGSGAANGGAGAGNY